MAKIDETYESLLLDILRNGYKYEDPNRKGINRIQISHATISHDFKDGFPALTTKELYWKGVVGELLWILRENTNIKYLVDNSINIWSKDAYKHYSNQCKIHNVEPCEFEKFILFIKNTHDSKNHFIPSKTNYKLGDLGRVYGAQWRKWKADYNETKYSGHGEQEYLDQISNLIKELKENPMGTKHIVTAWNPAELDDMALPPCHWSFEVLVEPLSIQKRFEYSQKYFNNGVDTKKPMIKLDELDVPKYQFTLKWHQRSVDTFLGLPFNIASYALLAQIIGKMTNMIPKGIIGDLSNVHIYEPHLDAVKEQLSRDVDKYGKCELHFAGEEANQGLEKGLVSNIDNLNIRNFKLRDYKSYPRIQAEMLAYSK